MKVWRESASLILAARNAQKYMRCSSPTNFQYNYNMLCLKRHQDSKFMPSNYVFPGGAVHPSDADLKWHNLFSTFGYETSSFESLTPNTAVRPRIFKSKPDELPREISLRISAIRETFEECGILICKKSREDSAHSDWANHIEIYGNELYSWQKKVHNDATEFYNLCENFECYPDLWSLYEWSNWLTPTYYPGRRFDTVFYMACLPGIPHTLYETSEIEDLIWDEPGNFIFTSLSVTLPPPQQYEIGRIAKFESIDNLLEFAIDRSKKGVLLNLPVMIELQDGKVHVLPGDSMYPKQISLFDRQVIDRTDITIKEFRDMSPIKNRLEYFNLQVKELFVQNFDSTDGHLSPMQLKSIRLAPLNKKSKLS